MGLLQESIQYLKGVGPHRFARFQKMGVETIWDLLTFYPRDYLDRRTIVPIASVRIGEYQTVEGIVERVRSRLLRKRVSLVEAVIFDGTARISAVWFNQPHIEKYIPKGEKIILSGKVSLYRKSLQMQSPQFDMNQDDALHTGRIVPSYHATEGLQQQAIRRIMKGLVEQYADEVKEWMPPSLCEKRKLIPLSEAFREIHFPTTFENLEIARHRLCYEELFCMEISIMLRKKKVVEQEGIAHEISEKIDQRIRNRMPFPFTAAQNKVIQEIREDLELPKPMYRLLQGDVGSGKTVVALYAMLAVIANGYQAAMMIPTTILGEQHTRTISSMLDQSRVRVSYIGQSIPQEEKKNILQDVKNGKVDLIIGTHALIQDGVEFDNLGIIVVDEQHKFGVMQRIALRDKGIVPDVLVMTATPIPRTLALTVYGDLDVSVIDELPKGRGEIKTHIVLPGNRKKAYEFVRRKIKEGRQVYIVAPIIEDSEKMDLLSVKKLYEVLSDEVFSEHSVALVHGKCTPQEKEDVMSRFLAGEIEILVSTTVVEVGVDVPNATIMIIEHAERYGLAQLHQLRGRIGRGSHDSYCFLFTNLTSGDARSRLEVMVKTNDGFHISEEDLRLRGPGEFLGKRQHGLPYFKIANILRDQEMIMTAREDAMEVLDKDVLLQSEELAGINEMMAYHVIRSGELVDIG